jgi:hypothetical protein
VVSASASVEDVALMSARLIFEYLLSDMRAIREK